jgi:hypothetical protein
MVTQSAYVQAHAQGFVFFHLTNLTACLKLDTGLRTAQ